MSPFAWFFSQWWGIFIAVVGGLAVIVLLYRPFFKRFFDILLSGFALILLSPVYLVLTLSVRNKLGSPVMFKQYRPGKHEKIFLLHKYRTMTEKKDGSGKLLPDEERLTKFGKFLRATSLDELPEIWDIFRGKMSIIGPRPLLVEYLPRYNERQRIRHNVRPGLTGLAQVMGRNSISWEQKFEYDVRYVEHINIFTDIKIFFTTVFKVFCRKGINQTGKATMEVFLGKTEKNILILSCGRRVELVRAFKAARDRMQITGNILGADCSEMAPALYFSDGKRILPPVASPEYLSALKQVLIEDKISLVIPTIDTELQILAENRSFLETTGARILIASPETVSICGDKAKTALFFVQHDIGCPKTYNSSELLKREEKYPLCVKPKSGSSSIDVFSVKNRKELEFFLDYVPNPIVQELLSGKEYTIDCLTDFDGNPLLIVPRRRIAVRAGEILKGQTDKNETIINDVKNLLKKLNAIGQITVQGFLGEDNKMRYFEINSRFGGGAPMSIKAGADFCECLYRLLLGEHLTYKEDWADQTVIARFDDSLVLSRD